MSDTVFVTQEGIIEILVIGDQTVESVRALGDEAARLGHELETAGKPVVILDNLLRIGKVPPEARRVVVENIKRNEYDRLAMLGTNPLIKFGSNLMFQASGKKHILKFFDNREAAVRWLQQGCID
jgi:hypothetical protein